MQSAVLLGPWHAGETKAIATSSDRESWQCEGMGD